MNLNHVVNNRVTQLSVFFRHRGKLSHKSMVWQFWEIKWWSFLFYRFYFSSLLGTRSTHPFRTQFLSFLQLQRINNFLSTIRLDFPVPEGNRSCSEWCPQMNRGLSTLYPHPLRVHAGPHTKGAGKDASQGHKVQGGTPSLLSFLQCYWQHQGHFVEKEKKTKQSKHFRACGDAGV